MKDAIEWKVEKVYKAYLRERPSIRQWYTDEEALRIIERHIRGDE